MPLWGGFWKNENDRAKLEQKMCVAKETPEPVFDLADCNLSEVPSGVFSMCRVFRKEALLLQNNQLQSLHSGGSLNELAHLKVLNLRDNRFSYLPDDIGCLKNLQNLNLENNRLKKLPASFENLTKLRHLILKGNRFSSFPLVLCNTTSLETLNICDNGKIKLLPKELSNLVYLRSLEFDSKYLQYPPEDVCENGTEAIMKFLCSESGKEYIPPSDIPKPDQDATADESDSTAESSWMYPELSASFQQYQRAKEQRRQELMLMEESLKENEEIQADLAAHAVLRRQKLLENVAQEQERMENEIMELQTKKDKEKQNLLAILTNIENHSAILLKQLVTLNEKNKNLDKMLEALEQDRLENEEMFVVKQEELAQLRKKEVLEAMTEMLQNEEKQRIYEASKLNIVEKLQNEENESNSKLLSVFHEREQDQQILICKLLEEEEYQKEAFKVLQLQKDRRHQEISCQIKLIEKELSNLTMAEIKKRDLTLNSEINMLAEHRTALAYLLTELLEAKEKREMELKNYLKQMEQRRIEEMEDFWLIQYQKLLDQKPQGIISAELTMDPAIRTVLVDANATDYLPIFAAKDITLPQLLSFTIDDLKEIGILDEVICAGILEKARGYSDRTVDKESPESPTSEESNVEPSAPYEPEASAPPLSPDAEVKLWCQNECVICMEEQSTAVFLPCGHVCCCQNCSSSVKECPMCRTEIASKFTLILSS